MRSLYEALSEQITREIDYEIMFGLDSYFVWSSGLQEWEPIVMTLNQWDTLKFQHSKMVKGKPLMVFRDETGRFIGSYMKELT